MPCVAGTIIFYIFLFDALSKISEFELENCFQRSWNDVESWAVQVHNSEESPGLAERASLPLCRGVSIDPARARSESSGASPRRPARHCARRGGHSEPRKLAAINGVPLGSVLEQRVRRRPRAGALSPTTTPAGQPGAGGPGRPSTAAVLVLLV